MATKKPLPIGSLVDALWKRREDKRALEEQMKGIEKDIEAQTLELLERMEKEGLDQVRGTQASISIGANVTATVTDWDAFGAWIIKSKNLHLLQRRVSDPAYRELLEHGKKIPGCEPFVRKRLNVRSL